MPRPAPLQVHLQPIDLESGVRVMWDVGLLCADLSLPRPHLLIWKRRNYTYIFVKMSTLYRCPV